MSDSRKPGFLLPVVVTLAVIAGVYVGAYYWMVEPIVLTGWVADLYSPGGRTPKHGYNPVSLWRTFFAPMNWLDRHIRPKVWEQKP